MGASDSVLLTIEITVSELKLLKKIIQHHNPEVQDEAIAFMLYQRITKKLEEKDG